ncbi:MAG: thiamine ABC transporter substrate-binding protein, partial [Thermoplasmata archaeon]|nr:thiamine ABC transporter substrate-binding protein [Thermoplasmata archaeon]
MSSTERTLSTPPVPRRKAGDLSRRLLAVVLALLLLLGGFGAYIYVAELPPAGETQLVIYTYPSLFGGSCGSAALTAAVAPFESAHHVDLEFECPSGTLVSTLVSEKGSPSADVVLGLDEVTTGEAEANGVLIPYDSPELAHVDPDLSAELSPDHAATPYEWGYLGIDYNTSFAAQTGGAVATSAFPSFASNLSWAKGLIVEDPTTDIVGEEFLLWEIEFYTAVLHENWQAWWQSVAASLQYAPDWGTAFGEFGQGATSPPMVVSYTTDPAYEVANGAGGTLNSTVSTWNGTEYGWRTVYGAGIVQGTHHLTLDQEFIDWFLQGTVQSAIPTNEWEYPANDTIPLPASFAANIDPGPIVPLDDQTTPTAIAAALPGYLDAWQLIETE